MFKEISVEKFFLFVSLVFGLIYVFILPPFQSVDEASHFYRSYEIISNKIVPQKVDSQLGDYLPLSLKKLATGYEFLIKHVDKKTNPKYIIDSTKITLNPDKIGFANFANTAIYSPVAYLGQLPGMYIAKAFNANPLLIFYAGRISNLIFFTLIIFLAIKIIPIYKLPMALLALMPMTLSLGGALTADVVVIGFNFLWVAMLIKILFEKKISNLQIIILYLLVLILTLSKDYVMLIPLIFLLPRSIFKNLPKYLICILGTIVISTIAFLLWQKVIDNVYINLNGSANALGQMKFILSNPFAYLLVLVKTLTIKTPRILITMIGVLGWQDTRLDFMTYMLYPILIILAILLETKTDFTFKTWQLYLIFIDILISIIMIFTNMYVMWSAVASPVIFGLNGKYFIPLILPLLLLFYNRIKFDITNKDQIRFLIYVLLILILISSDLSLLHRFYGLTPNLHYNI